MKNIIFYNVIISLFFSVTAFSQETTQTVAQQTPQNNVEQAITTKKIVVKKPVNQKITTVTTKTTVKPVQATQAKPVTPVKPIPNLVAKTAPETTWGFNLDENLNIQVEKQDDGTQYQYFDHQFNPWVKTQNYKFEAFLEFYDYYKTPEASFWENSAFTMSLNKPWFETDYFKFDPQARIVLPLFLKDSSGDFQFAGAGQLTAVLKSKELDVPKLILKYGIRLMAFGQKHQSKQNPDGTFILDKNGDKQYNTQYRIRQRFHLGYVFAEKLTALFFFYFDSNLLFDGNFRNGFYHNTLLEYAFNDHFTARVGITNGGGIYVGDYQEQDNLKFYDKASTEYFAGVGLSF